MKTLFCRAKILICFRLSLKMKSLTVVWSCYLQLGVSLPFENGGVHVTILLPLCSDTCVRLQGELFCLSKALMLLFAPQFSDRAISSTGDAGCKSYRYGISKTVPKILLLFKNQILAGFGDRCYELMPREEDNVELMITVCQQLAGSCVKVYMLPSVVVWDRGCVNNCLKIALCSVFMSGCIVS